MQRMGRSYSLSTTLGWLFFLALVGSSYQSGPSIPTMLTTRT